MRRVVATLLASLDGFASDAPHEEMRWVADRSGEEVAGFGLRQMQALDTLVLGRVTYEMMAAYWPTAGEEESGFAELMNSIPKVVFSTSLSEEDITWDNTRLAKVSLADEIASLKQQLGRDIGLRGSVDLVRALVKLGLIDRLTLQVHPWSWGRRAESRSSTVTTPPTLDLVDTTVLDSRVVVLEYRPAPGAVVSSSATCVAFRALGPEARRLAIHASTRVESR